MRLVRPRVTLAVLVIAALAPCFTIVLGGHLQDLAVYRAGGHAVLTGRPLYDVRLRTLGFTYPPFAGLLFTGFGALPLGVDTAIVTVVSLGALAVLVHRIHPDSWRRPTAVPVVIGLAALVACEPVRATLWNGQIDLVLAALITTDLLRPARRGTGVGVGLAAAIKLTPAIFVGYLLVRRRYREAAVASATFVAATACAWLVLPADSVRFWTHEMFAGSGLGDVTEPSNQSFLGVLLREAPSVAFPVWVLLVVPTAVVGLRAARWASTRGHEVLAVGTVGITGCLMSPVSWSHHWIWGIPLVLGLATSARTLAMQRWTIGAGIVFFGQYLVPAAVARAWGPERLILDNAFLLVGVLTPLVWLRTERRARTLHSPQPSARLGVGTL